jgi:hypothetical protein
MKVDFEKFYWAIKIAVLLLFVAVLVFLTVQKIVLSGSLEYNVAFNQPNKFVYGLYPEGRVIVDAGGWKLVGEPVYFKIYAPKKFKKADVTLKYIAAKNSQLAFGVKTNVVAEVPYELQKLGAIGKMVEQTLTFDLSNASFENNKLQFIVSAPGVEKLAEPLVIYGARFVLSQ